MLYIEYIHTVDTEHSSQVMFQKAVDRRWGSWSLRGTGYIRYYITYTKRRKRTKRTVKPERDLA